MTTAIPQSPPLWATFYFANPRDGSNATGEVRALIVGWQAIEDDDEHGPAGWYPIAQTAQPGDARVALRDFSRGRELDDHQEVWLEPWPAECMAIPYVLDMQRGDV